MNDSDYIKDIGEARSQFLDKTHDLIKQQTDIEKTDLIFQIRAIFYDVFGEADQRELDRINKRLKIVGTRPTNPATPIPNGSGRKPTPPPERNLKCST